MRWNNLFISFVVAASIDCVAPNLSAATFGRVVPIGGHAAAYVCRNFTCQRPVTTVADLDGVLYDRQDGRIA